jgi:tRNA 2-thiouridine synthesizing protein E
MEDPTDILERGLDQDGFLTDPRLWNREVAEKIALSSGVEALGDAHWRTIKVLRRHYLDNGTIPPERLVCHEAELEEDCLHQLFNDNIKSAWRIAGLPNPGEEAKTYM